MKIPNNFIIKIRTNFCGRRYKSLLEKVPLTFSFAKNLWNGGRYSYNNNFKCKVVERKNYNKKIVEIILFFEKNEKKR